MGQWLLFFSNMQVIWIAFLWTIVCTILHVVYVNQLIDHLFHKTDFLSLGLHPLGLVYRVTTIWHLCLGNKQWGESKGKQPFHNVGWFIYKIKCCMRMVCLTPVTYHLMLLSFILWGTVLMPRVLKHLEIYLKSSLERPGHGIEPLTGHSRYRTQYQSSDNHHHHSNGFWSTLNIWPLHGFPPLLDKFLAFPVM